jgi:hypothetical protein
MRVQTFLVLPKITWKIKSPADLKKSVAQEKVNKRGESLHRLSRGTPT